MLVLGGYGTLATDYANCGLDDRVHVIFAGRRKPRCELVDVSRHPDARATVSAGQVKADSLRLDDDIPRFGARIVVNLCGRFNDRNLASRKRASTHMHTTASFHLLKTKRDSSSTDDQRLHFRGRIVPQKHKGPAISR